MKPSNPNNSVENKSDEKKPKENKFLKDMTVSFLLPTIGGKIAILWFESNYAQYPGEGYGYGLAISVLFTATMIGRFLWKYRNHKD